MTPIMHDSSFTKVLIIICIAFLMLFPHYLPLPFYSYALVCCLVIYLFLKRQGLRLTDMGLTKQGISIKAGVVGLCTGLIWLGFILWVYIPLVNRVAVTKPEGYTEYNFLIGNLPAYLMTLVASWIVGGVYEELAFRGFIRFGVEQLVAPIKYKLYIGVVVSSILFGLYHIQQGIFGVIGATLGGLYWAVIVVKNRGDLWPAIFSHAVYDTAALTMIYLDIFPGQH